MAVDLTGNNFEGSMDELKAAMMGLTTATTGVKNTLDTKLPDYKAMLDELRKLPAFLSDFNKNVKDLSGAIDSLTKKSSGSGGTGSIDTQPIVDAVTKLHDCLCGNQVNKQEKNFLKLQAAFFKHALGMYFEPLNKSKSAAPSGPSSSGSSGAPPVDVPNPSSLLDYDDYYDETRRKLEELYNIEPLGKKFLGVLQDLRRTAEQTFLGFDEKSTVYGKTFGDLVGVENKFNIQLKETAFEIAGITSEMKSAQKTYTDVGQSVAETGFNRTKYLEQYTENFRAGITDAKVLGRVTKQTLATEKQLGLEAGSLSETFRDLTLSGKLNTAQIGAMGRNMSEVARNTGLTGKHLQAAMDSSKPFLENLKKAATFTAASAKNILEVAANAKKLGVGDSVSPLLNAATSTVNLITQANSETQAFLYNAAGRVGKITQLQMGVLTRTKKGIKDLAAGMEDVLKGFGVQSMEEIENLPDEVKFRLNLQLKGAFGMELGEITRTVQAFKEAGKGLSDRLVEINKKRELNLTLEEKTRLAEEERRLKAGATLDVLTGLSEASKGAKSMDEAMARFNNRLPEFADDIKALGGDVTSARGAAKFSIESAVKSLNEGLTKVGEKPLEIDQMQVEKALSNKEEYNLLMERLNEANNKLATAQKAELDPVLKTSLTLEKYNDFFRDQFSKPALDILKAQLGFQGTMAFALSSMAAEGMFNLAIFIKDQKKTFDAIKQAWDKNGWRGLKDVIFGAKKDKKDGPSAAPKPADTPKPPAAGGGGGGGGTPECPDLSKFKFNVDDLGGLLIKAAKVLGAIVIGVALLAASIALLAGIVKVYSKVVGIDPLKVAYDVSAIILAGAIILTEAGIVAWAFQKAYDTYGKDLMGIKGAKVLGFAAIIGGLAAFLIIVSTALLALGKAAAKYAGFTSAKDVMETAAIVGAILAAGTLIMASVSATVYGFMKALPAFMAALAAIKLSGGVVAGIFLIGMPLLGAFMLAVSIGLLKLADSMMKALNIDLGLMQQTAKTISILVASASVIMVAIAGSAAALIGVAILAKKAEEFNVSLEDINKSLVLIGKVGMGLVGMIGVIGGVVAAINLIDVSSKESEFKNAEMILTMVNKMLMAMAPMLITIVLLTAALTLLQVQQQNVADETQRINLDDIAENASFVTGFLLGIMLVLPPLIAGVLALVGKIVSMVADPKKLEEQVAALQSIMMSFYKAMLLMLPMVAIALGIGILMQKLGVGVWAVLKLLGTGTIILAALIGVGVILMGIAVGVASLLNTMLSGEMFTNEGADLFATRLSNLAYVMGVMALYITLAAAGAGWAAAAIVAAGITFTLFSGAVWAFGETFYWAMNGLAAVNEALQQISFTDLMLLPMKLYAVALSLNLLTKSFDTLRKINTLLIFDAATKMRVIAPVVLEVAKILSDMNVALYQVVNMAGAEAGPKALLLVTETARNIAQFFKDITTMDMPDEAKLQKAYFKFVAVASYVAQFVEIVKYIAIIPKVLKFTPALAKKASQTYVEMSIMLTSFLQALTAYADSVQKFKSMQWDKFAMGLLGTKEKDTIRDMIKFSQTLVETTAKLGEEFDAEQHLNAVGALENAGNVLALFAKAMESFQAGQKAVTGAVEGYSAGIKERSRALRKAGKNDGETDEFVNVSRDLLQSMTKIIKVIYDNLANNQYLHANNVAMMADKLNNLSSAIDVFGKSMENISSKLNALFKYEKSWHGMSSYAVGQGAKLSEQAAGVRVGVIEIFDAIDTIFKTFTEKQRHDSWVKSLTELEKFQDIFGKVTTAMGKIGDTFKTFYSTVITKFANIAPDKTWTKNADGEHKDWSKFNAFVDKMGDAMASLGSIVTIVIDKINTNLTVDNSAVQSVIAKIGQIDPFLRSLVGVSNSIQQLDQMGGVNVPEGQSIKDSGNRLAEAAAGVLSVANDIAVKTANIDMTGTATAALKLAAVSKFIDPLVNFLKMFSDKSDLLAKANKDASVVPPVDNIKANAPKISEAVTAIMSLYNTVVKGTAGVSTEGTEEAGKRLQAVLPVMESISSVIESMNKAFAALNEEDVDASAGAKSTNKIKNLEKTINDMLGQGANNPLLNVFKFIQSGLITPLNDLDLDPEEVADAGKTFEGLAKIATSVATSITSLGGAFSKVTMGKTSYLDVVTKILKNNKGQIIEMIKALGDFVVPIANLEIDGEDADDAAKIIEASNKILRVLAGEKDDAGMGLIGYMGNRLRQIGEQVAKQGGGVEPSLAEKAKAGLENFAKTWETMLPAINTLIMKTVEHGGSGDDAEEAAKIIAGSEKIVKALPSLLENMSKSLPTLAQQAANIAQQAGLGQQLQGKGPALANLLIGVFDFLRIGVIEPIGNLEMNYDIEDVAETLQGASTLAETLAGPVSTIAANLSNLDLTQVDFSKMTNFGPLFQGLHKLANEIMGANLPELTQNLTQAATDLAGVDTALQSLVASFAGISGSLNSLQAMGNLNVSASVNQTATTAVENPTNQAAKTVDMSLAPTAMGAAQSADMAKLTAAAEATASNTGQMLALMRSYQQAGGGAQGGSKPSPSARPDPAAYRARQNLKFSSATDAANFK